MHTLVRAPSLNGAEAGQAQKIIMYVDQRIGRGSGLARALQWMDKHTSHQHPRNDQLTIPFCNNNRQEKCNFVGRETHKKDIRISPSERVRWPEIIPMSPPHRRRLSPSLYPFS